MVNQIYLMLAIICFGLALVEFRYKTRITIKYVAFGLMSAALIYYTRNITFGGKIIGAGFSGMGIYELIRFWNLARYYPSRHAEQDYHKNQQVRMALMLFSIPFVPRLVLKVVRTN